MAFLAAVLQPVVLLALAPLMVLLLYGAPQ